MLQNWFLPLFPYMSQYPEAPDDDGAIKEQHMLDTYMELLKSLELTVGEAISTD